MEIRRGLLTVGNKKLGESIHAWSLPALETCPGSTAVCRSVCYALTSRYRFQAVRERLAWNLEQARRDDFADRMVREVRRKGCLVIRVHAAGDFEDASYASKWLWVMKKCPRPRFYFYSRSWRCESIRPVLEQMAALKCCKAWYSVDSETGLPASVPPGVRLAYLQVDKGETVGNADLLFRVRGLRRASRVGLPTVCPAEIAGAAETNCGSCQRCFR